MDNGEMRLQGLIRPEDEPSEEELEVTRQELLAGADPNTPSWNVTVSNRGIRPDILLDLNFASNPNTPVATEIKKGVISELRRFFTSIFS